MCTSRKVKQESARAMRHSESANVKVYEDKPRFNITQRNPTDKSNNSYSNDKIQNNCLAEFFFLHYALNEYSLLCVCVCVFCVSFHFVRLLYSRFLIHSVVSFILLTWLSMFFDFMLNLFIAPFHFTIRWLLGSQTLYLYSLVQVWASREREGERARESAAKREEKQKRIQQAPEEKRKICISVAKGSTYKTNVHYKLDESNWNM